MKQTIKENDWRKIISELRISPINEKEQDEWRQDLIALKRGPQSFLARMNTWPSGPYGIKSNYNFVNPWDVQDGPVKYRLFGRGNIPVGYVISPANAKENFEGITPGGNVGYKIRGPGVVYPDPVKFPARFESEQEMMDFIKYTRMVHIYKRLVSIERGLYDNERAENKAKINMSLVTAGLKQAYPRLKLNSYILNNSSLMSEVLGLCGFTLDGKELTGLQQADFIIKLVQDYVKSIRNKEPIAPRHPKDKTVAAYINEEQDRWIKEDLKRLSPKQKDQLLFQLLKERTRK